MNSSSLLAASLLLALALAAATAAPVIRGPSGAVARGATVYARHCARCHVRAPIASSFYGDLGPSGYVWPDAQALYDVIRTKMPKDRPGALPRTDVLAVAAWILAKNEVLPVDGRLWERDLAELRIGRVVELNWGAPAPPR